MADEPLILFGSLAGVAAGRIEEKIHPQAPYLKWYAGLGVALIGGAVSVFHKKAGIAVASFGAGIVVNDALNFLTQSEMPWAKNIIAPGQVKSRKLPSWQTGRTSEEIMADDIKAAIWRGKNDLRIRNLAIKLIKEADLDGRQHKEIAFEIQKWVQGNIRYVNDPFKTEIFQESYRTLENRIGDCDDQTILTAALMMSVGIPTKVILLSQDAPFNHKTGRFTHIFSAAIVDGRDYWVETIIPATFDYRAPHSATMEIDMTTPSLPAKKKIVLAEEEDLSDLARYTAETEQNMGLMVI